MKTSIHIAGLVMVLFVVVACGDDDGGVPDGGTPLDASSDGGGLDAAPQDAGPDVDAGRCIAADVTGGWFLVGEDDTSIMYRARVTPQIDSQPFDVLIWFQRYGGVELVGEFPLGVGDDANFSTCAHCVMMFYGTSWTRGFFADGGTLEVRRDPFSPRADMTLRDVTLEEVEIVAEGEGAPVLVSRPIPGGRCVTLPDITIATVFPPAEWRCDPEQFADGATCDCSCGAYDPDCNELALPTTGCTADQACVVEYGDLYETPDGVCAESCEGGRACSEGACGWWFGEHRVCFTDPDRIADADVGEPCSPDGSWLFCAEEGGVIGGVCDDTCRASCESDADCDVAAFEWCLPVWRFTSPDVEPGTEGGPGYCVPTYPPDWTCSGGDYQDGAICHCGCGTWDPDCGEVDSVRTAPTAGCAGSEVCVLVDENGIPGQTTCVTPPANDTCVSAAPLVIGGVTSGTSRGAMNHYTPTYGPGGCSGSNHYGFDVVYRVELVAGQRLRIDALPVDFDLSMYLVGPGDATLCDEGPLSCAAFADAARDGLPERLEHTAVTSGTYYLVVDSFFPRSGTFTLDSRVE